MFKEKKFIYLQEGGIKIPQIPQFSESPDVKQPPKPEQGKPEQGEPAEVMGKVRSKIDKVETLPENERIDLFKAVKILKKASKGKEQSVVIAGKTIPRDQFECVISNIESALKFVKDQFRLPDIILTQYSGEIVGESVKEGIKLDSAILMHPATRIAHIIFHELLHQKDGIGHDGLVEYKTKLLMKKAGLIDDSFKPTEKYKQAEDNIQLLVSKIAGDKDPLSVTEQIGKLYAKGNIKAIYNLYLKFARREWNKTRRESGLARKDFKYELEKINKFFADTFPEYDMDPDKNKFVLRGNFETESPETPSNPVNRIAENPKT